MTLPPPISNLTNCFLEEVDSRLPGRLTGLFLHGSICWGEFFPGSDIDFIGLWDELSTGKDLDLLKAAHESTKRRLPTPTFDGVHCTATDPTASRDQIPHRPVFYQDAFDPGGTVDINRVMVGGSELRDDRRYRVTATDLEPRCSRPYLSSR